MNLIEINVLNYNTENEKVELKFAQDVEKLGDDTLRIIPESISLAAGMIAKMLPSELQTEFVGVLVRTVSNALNNNDKTESTEENKHLPQNAVKFKSGLH